MIAAAADWRRRFGLTGLIALAYLILVIAVALIPGRLAPFDPLKVGVGLPADPPSSTHLFGTDDVGRDALSRIIWGARTSVVVSVSATVIALSAGMVLGSIIAVRRGVASALVTMLINLILVFPGVVFAIALATVLGPGVTTTAIVLSVLYVPPISRVVAAAVESQYGRTYVTALKAIGAGDLFIIRRAVARIVAPTVMTFGLVVLADAVLIEAALSFIGVGVQPPTPSWGNIISSGRNLVPSGGWWVSAAGGLSVVAFAVAINRVADVLGSRHTQTATWRSESGTELVPLAARAEAGQPARGTPLLAVDRLSVYLPDHYGNVAVVDGVTFRVDKGEVVSLVGESGSGKSLIGMAILGLLPPGGRAEGSILVEGRSILNAPERQLVATRGSGIALLPQDSVAALNPVLTIGRQLDLVCRLGSTSKPAQLLDLVQLPSKRVLGSYPHELSGGQCQRVALAIALARSPKLLVADEPTTSLDVSLQAEIFALIQRLRNELGFSLLLISHDLALVATVAERLSVMYAGRLVESGRTRDVMERPAHPYTAGLMGSVTSLERRDATLVSIKGAMPEPLAFARGCRFAGRCPVEMSMCATERPSATVLEGGRVRFCHQPVSEIAAVAR